MADPKDTLLRQIVTLQLIPRLPGRIATTTLQEKLAERGFDVNLRSLQRDLKDRLSLQFPLICDESEKPFRWSFASDTHISLPGMDTPTALTLHLAEEHLRTLLPASVADLLNPQFDEAKHHLQGLSSNSLAQWARMVRALPNGKTLIPAPVDGEVWRLISEALLGQQQIKIQYLSRNQGEEREFHLHPAGMVSRYSISYLIARVEGYDNLRHFALHRIRAIELLNERSQVPADFDIDQYIQQGAFSMSSGKDTKLVADIHPQLAWILRETPLSHEQSIEPVTNNDWVRLGAVVPMDLETLWWIMGLGEKIRVREPEEWVEVIKKQQEKLCRMYQMD